MIGGGEGDFLFPSGSVLINSLDQLFSGFRRGLFTVKRPWRIAKAWPTLRGSTRKVAGERLPRREKRHCHGQKNVKHFTRKAT